jgi:acetyl esterase/lipase
MFVPKDGVSPENERRILINLHGGGFIMGARTVGAIESVPIASLGKITVISIDYRMAPEHKFPAATEDVVAVYKALLKDYKPSDIGIYGCSAGGMLAGEAIAWFQKEGLPNPAAIGVFCATLGDFDDGDSAWISHEIGGMLAAPSPHIRLPYFAGVAPDDPLAYPVTSPALLAHFPPTLFITGTRAKELSSAVHSHIQLLKAGVDAEIAIWDGMDHAFINDPDLPESREAYDVIVTFFKKHLGK